MKKIWYQDYRYSEDLDFTFEGEWNETTLIAELNSMFEWVLDESNMSLSFIPDRSSDHQFKFQFNFSGPLGGNKNVTCDISKNERVNFPVEEKLILDTYSDNENDFKIRCYSIEEVLAEKLRCTMQRTIPRDLYDIWYLTDKGNIDIRDVAFEFIDKAKHKKYDPLKLLDEILKKTKKKTIYQNTWETSLKNQIKNLPKFDGSLARITVTN